jgi:hypothetical protein
VANTLTGLVPTLYEALDVVSRELVGFIPSVTLDARADRAALNQVIMVPITPAGVAEDVTPGQLPADDGDNNIGNNQIIITKSRVVPFRWTGEDQMGINTGVGYQAMRVNQITQAMRTLCNEVETNVGTLARTASRAFGTPGTTPFASDLSATAGLRKILADNGSSLSDMKLVIDTTSGAKMRNLSQLTFANEAGTTDLRAQGTLLKLHGFDIRESAGVLTGAAVGSVTGAVTGSAAAGATTVTLTTPSGGAVALLAGDIVTFAGDTNQYVAAAASTIGASTTGALTLEAPGLRQTISAAAITVVATGTRNLAFDRSAIVLATRAPALPEEGDMASDRMLITDPRSGLTFEIAMYPQYRRVRYEISMAYGWANIKPEHVAILWG